MELGGCGVPGCSFRSSLNARNAITIAIDGGAPLIA
jgi:hypothetical protein